ncbi:MAG: hypothetical protein Q7S53_02080 [bacterium]|nr:hypothetical protein [bacterium]
MSQADNIQAPIPESKEQVTNSQGEIKEAALPETGSQKMGEPVPGTTKSDNTIPATISKVLEPDAKTPAVQPASGTAPASAQRPSSEPYIKAAEDIIQKDKGDPHKEEDDHEVIQMQYLSNRFGKNIKKK